jgi:hypothetical protein
MSITVDDDSITEAQLLAADAESTFRVWFAALIDRMFGLEGRERG